MKKFKQNTEYIITIKRIYEQERKDGMTNNTDRFYDVYINKGFGHIVSFAIPIGNNLTGALRKVFRTIKEELCL